MFTVHIYYNVKISGGRFSGEKNMWREILDEISNEQGGTKIMHAYITQKKKKKKNQNYARIHPQKKIKIKIKIMHVLPAPQMASLFLENFFLPPELK